VASKKKGSTNGKRKKSFGTSKRTRGNGQKKVSRQKRSTVSSPRDYRAEYQRRLVRAKERGYSKDVARGHARRGTLGLRAAQRARRSGFDVSAGESIAGSLRDSIERAIARDAKRVFGRKPKRRKGEEPFIYEERLQGAQKKPERQFAWTDEQEFKDYIVSLGLTERDAYTFWFSP